jgi:16S rRNA (cytosine1402-N4)-methyltransferase
MEFIHKPVLLDECIKGLALKPDGVYIDGTVGGGGHSSKIIEKLSEKGTLICIDQDDEALNHAKEVIVKTNVNGAKVFFAKSNFRNIEEVCKQFEIIGVDGVLLDIGVSSYQLDNPERGFSYNHDAPLDMRMDLSNTLTAEEIVNQWPEAKIKEIIQSYGEERWASRIASFIVNRREEKSIYTTLDLVDIIKRAIPKGARKEGPHPAKRVFQSIRIAVNDELRVLELVIKNGMNILKQDGRFCIITFHSLEDRIVKTSFSKLINPCQCPRSFPICICGKIPLAKMVHKKPIISSDKELEDNPRSRSAKLRIVEKI